jgi:hypothetical protein
MSRGSQFFTYMAIAAILISFILFFTMGFADGLGLDADMGDALIAVLPGILLCICSIILITGIGGQILAIIGFGASGVSVAVLLQEMYDANILIDSMLGGATIAQYEIIITIFGLLLGAVAFMSHK